MKKINFFKAVVLLAETPLRLTLSILRYLLTDLSTGFGPICPHRAIQREGTPRTRGRTGHRPPPSRYHRARCALWYREGFSRIGRSSREHHVP